MMIVGSLPRVDTREILEFIRVFGVDDIYEIDGMLELRISDWPLKPMRAKLITGDDGYQVVLNFKMKEVDNDTGFYTTPQEALERSLKHFFHSYFYNVTDINSIEPNKDF
jgi:hypothetical protein